MTDVNEFITLALEELERATKKHPHWPKDILHATMVMAEEAGESVQGALDYTYAKKPKEDFQEELIQTIAMCLRILRRIDEIVPMPSPSWNESDILRRSCDRISYYDRID